MICWVGQGALEDYLKNDYVLERLNREVSTAGREFTSDRWLRDSPPKRLIYHYLYGDLLSKPRLKVLDIGGSLAAINWPLYRRHDYTVVDLLAHENDIASIAYQKEFGQQALVVSDWYDLNVENDYFDIVICNDLFPNVDQRLEIFLARFVPLCDELRISLTYYDAHRFYLAKRLDGDEIFCMLAWNGSQVSEVLKPFADQLGYGYDDLFGQEGPSLFSNGRQVCIATLSGGRSK